MIQGIGNSGSLAQTAIEAALKAHDAASKRIEMQRAEVAGRADVPQASGTNFSKALNEGLHGVNAAVNKVDALSSDLVAGKITNFHEIAVHMKQSELTFKFALEVRNKLIDAYRETMRMSV